MLLACCFREPKNKKHKKRKNGKEDSSLPDKEDDRAGDSARLLDRPSEDGRVYTVYTGHEGPGGFTVHGATVRPPSSQAGSSLDLKLHQERHPPSKEARRLSKQKSQESLRSNRSVRSRSIQGNTTIPYIDQSPVTEESAANTLEQRKENPPSPLNKRKESLPSPPTTPKEAKRPLSQQDTFPLLEDSSLQKHASEPPASSPTPSIPCQGQSSTKRYSTSSRLSSPSKSWTDSQSSLSKLDDSGPALRGMQRSRAFHDGAVLEDQVKKDEEIKQREAELVRRLEAEHQILREKERAEHREQLERVEKKLQARLLDEDERHKKKLENAVMNAKNEANATISQLNRQIVTERAKLVAEQQQNSQNLGEEFRLKEERLKNSIRQTEEREKAWQQEKAEVLQEVQRLKAEASKMVQLLAMETEDEQLSEERKRCLTAEVYSLQLVVEMRTGEVRNLREQLAKATRDLEELEMTRDKLRRAEARLDDLQEQVALKDRLEKQLSEEKSQLERTVSSSSRAVERMSQNVEELQWRIRNNFDLPVTHLTCREGGQPVSLPDFNTTTESPVTRPRPHSTPQLNQAGQRKNSLFTVSHEMLEATREQEAGEEEEEVGATSDFSPSSDTGGPEGMAADEGRYPEELVSRGNEDHEKEELQSDIDEAAEVDSLDEGLGDISSENETVDSPTPDVKEAGMSLVDRDNSVGKCVPGHQISNTSNTTSPERRKFLELQLTASPPCIPSSVPPSVPQSAPPDLSVSESPATSPVKSPVKERIPSRIAFETPL